MRLGLRHQGVLLTAVRGPDTSPKEDAVKALVRCYRAAVLNAHCGDPRKAKTFIEAVDTDTLYDRMGTVARDGDALPHHYVMHLVHAAEVVGYKHPTPTIAQAWLWFYGSMVHGLHLSPESEAAMDRRLTADEESFFASQSRLEGTEA
jgi:hypothetical protein